MVLNEVQKQKYMLAMPEKVSFIIDKLYEAGYEAYAVGGCVRDSLLGMEPKDWDITTSAGPYEVKALFHRTFDTGIEHGTVTVLLDKDAFEVTTYRIDGKYNDSRHPSEVRFTPNLSEDLLRRDFTINAMAYNYREGLVDLFDGLADLENGIIRAVGDPVKRFDEDALRIMRALRFAAVLGFKIEEQTLDAMKIIVPKLKLISAERIKAELFKMVSGRYPGMLHVAYENHVTGIIFPEWDDMEETAQENAHHIYNCAWHTIQSIIAMNCILGRSKPEQLGIWSMLSEEEKNRVITLFNRLNYYEISDKLKENLSVTMLLHDIGKPATKTFDGVQAHFYGHEQKSAETAVNILKRLKCDNETIDDIKTLVLHHDERYHGEWEPGSARARRLANKIGIRLMFPFIMVQLADLLAHRREDAVNGFDTIERMIILADEIILKSQAVSLKTLCIKGRDLIDMGVKPGPELGDILNELLERILEVPEDNNREVLLPLAREIIRRKSND